MKATQVIFKESLALRSDVFKNNKVKRTLINKILPYSARKKRAKPPLLYSVLNPETSSDSPSEKSKGVRFVSARVEMNHTRARGGVRKINHWQAERSSLRWKSATRVINLSRIIASLTS